jgi:hypothetical protein
MKDKLKVIEVKYKDMKDRYLVIGNPDWQWQNNKILFSRDKMINLDVEFKIWQNWIED